MSCSQLRLAGSSLLLIGALFLLVACASGPAPQATAPTPVPTATPTPSPALTPLPPVPTARPKTVHFSTSDHVVLAGLLFGQGKTAVVCSHMLRTNKFIWSETGMPQRLAQLGYMVLIYDFRGNGDSQGTSDPSMLAVDLHAAVTFVRQQGATSSILLGASMGGTASLKVAASEKTRAVITLSAPADFGVSVTDADVQAISGAKLFVNSQNDPYSSDTQHLYDTASQPKELHLYDGVDHGTALFSTFYNDLTWRILKFLATYAPAT